MGNGRRPLPNAIKELAGNPGHRPLNTDEPKPRVGLPEMPKGMSFAAQREWNSIAPELLRLGVLSNIDGKALAAYCDAYAMWEQARKEMKKYGMVLRVPKCDKDGNVIIIRVSEDDKEGSPTVVKEASEGKIVWEHKANPAVGIYEKMAKLMKSFLIEFGLTPASRSKLHVEKAQGAEEIGLPARQDTPPPTAAQVEKIRQEAPLHFKTKNTGMPDISAASTNFEA